MHTWRVKINSNVPPEMVMTPTDAYKDAERPGAIVPTRSWRPKGAFIGSPGDVSWKVRHRSVL